MTQCFCWISSSAINTCCLLSLSNVKHGDLYKPTHHEDLGNAQCSSSYQLNNIYTKENHMRGNLTPKMLAVSVMLESYYTNKMCFSEGRMQACIFHLYFTLC